MEINPLNVEAQNNMALVLATFPETRLRNGTKAIELAERADHLTGNENASINATLAAVYAEIGRFPNAVETAKRALQLATDQGNTVLADAIRAQIRLYQSGLPSRYNGQPSVRINSIFLGRWFVAPTNKTIRTKLNLGLRGIQMLSVADAPQTPLPVM